MVIHCMLASRDHIFINYATEDGALARWLAAKLTSEGFAVWCDALKLLGGEPYPQRIDEAIQARTVRMLSLLSRSSIAKANPVGERTLALNVGRKLGIDDFVIPINVDGLSAHEVPWMVSAHTYIPFHTGWHGGLRQLLKKLEEVGAPRPVGGGRIIAASSFVQAGGVADVAEPIHSNCFRVREIPQVVYKFRVSHAQGAPPWSELAPRWPHHSLSESEALSFWAPPEGSRLIQAGGGVWTAVDEFDGVRSRDIVFELMRKSLDWHLSTRGLHFSTDQCCWYFPRGAVERDSLRVRLPGGKKTRVSVVGTRKAGSGPARTEFHYHLAPRWSLRGDLDDLWASLLVRTYLTDTSGRSLPGRQRRSRWRKVYRGWWNHQWLSRTLGIAQHLAGGRGEILIGPPGRAIVLDADPISFSVPVSLDESCLTAPKRKAIEAMSPSVEGGVA